MRLGVISDLHFDRNARNGHQLFELLVERVRLQQVERLLIAGDVASGAHAALRWLERLERRLPCAVDFVPGNHDIWDLGSSRVAYDRLAAHPSCLAGRVRILPNNWVLVGDLGWYDYSFRHPRVPLTTARRKRWGPLRWLDAYRANWHSPDAEVAGWFANRLECRLRQHSGSQLLLATHMVPYRRFVGPHHRRRWQFLHAYLGSARYGRLADRYEVALVVFGHSHRRHRTVHSGRPIICNPVGYIGRDNRRSGRDRLRVEVVELGAGGPRLGTERIAEPTEHAATGTPSNGRCGVHD